MWSRKYTSFITEPPCMRRDQSPDGTECLKETSRGFTQCAGGGYEGKPAPLDLMQSMFSRGNVDR